MNSFLNSVRIACSDSLSESLKSHRRRLKCSQTRKRNGYTEGRCCPCSMAVGCWAKNNSKRLRESEVGGDDGTTSCRWECWSAEVDRGKRHTVRSDGTDVSREREWLSEESMPLVDLTNSTDEGVKGAAGSERSWLFRRVWVKACGNSGREELQRISGGCWSGEVFLTRVIDTAIMAKGTSSERAVISRRH